MSFLPCRPLPPASLGAPIISWRKLCSNESYLSRCPSRERGAHSRDQERDRRDGEQGAEHLSASGRHSLSPPWTVRPLCQDTTGVQTPDFPGCGAICPLPQGPVLFMFRRAPGQELGTINPLLALLLSSTPQIFSVIYFNWRINRHFSKEDIQIANKQM